MRSLQTQLLPTWVANPRKPSATAHQLAPSSAGPVSVHCLRAVARTDTNTLPAEHDQFLLLAIEYVAKARGIKLPWAEAAKLMEPETTAAAIEQHLSKLRTRRHQQGLLIPPPPTQARYSRVNRRTSSTPQPKSKKAVPVSLKGLINRKTKKPAQPVAQNSNVEDRMTRASSNNHDPEDSRSNRPLRTKRKPVVYANDFSDDDYVDTPPKKSIRSVRGNSLTLKDKTKKLRAGSPVVKREDSEDALVDDSLALTINKKAEGYDGQVDADSQPADSLMPDSCMASTKAGRHSLVLKLRCNTNLNPEATTSGLRGISPEPTNFALPIIPTLGLGHDLQTMSNPFADHYGLMCRTALPNTPLHSAEAAQFINNPSLDDVSAESHFSLLRHGQASHNSIVEDFSTLQPFGSTNSLDSGFDQTSYMDDIKPEYLASTNNAFASNQISDFENTPITSHTADMSDISYSGMDSQVIAQALVPHESYDICAMTPQDGSMFPQASEGLVVPAGLTENANLSNCTLPIQHDEGYYSFRVHMNTTAEPSADWETTLRSYASNQHNFHSQTIPSSLDSVFTTPTTLSRRTTNDTEMSEQTPRLDALSFTQTFDFGRIDALDHEMSDPFNEPLRRESGYEADVDERNDTDEFMSFNHFE